MKAILALEDGRVFDCHSFTGHGEALGEAVFNTGMTGYQEALTDPSYHGQMLAMTYPLVGNYGVNSEDVESDRVRVRAFLVKECQKYPSNFRSESTLADYLSDQGVLGVEDLDTRALTRHIRKAGSMRACVSTRDLDPGSCVKKAKESPSMKGLNLADEVSTQRPFMWKEGRRVFLDPDQCAEKARDWRKEDQRPLVAVFDFGVKYNILRCLERAGIKPLILPARTGAKEVMALCPDGVFLSNGPGDPEPATHAIETVKKLLGFRPMFGICLGHQILGLALGGKTYKLKFGHRGGNQPVKNLLTGRVEITSQNHGFAVDMDSLKAAGARLTHVNLNDDTVEGFSQKDARLIAVQHHPEAAPGPLDAKYMFKEFLGMMV
jgi:carbamoyl-phosphate synthase small subunit